MKPLVIPGILLLIVATLLHTGLFVPSGPVGLYAFFAACIAGVLLSWRFHSSRVFLSLLVLLLAQQLVWRFTSARWASLSSERMALLSVGLLLPVNFALISMRQEKGFSLSGVAPYTVFLFVQSVIVAALCRPEPFTGARHGVHHALAPSPLPFAVQFCFAGAAIVFIIRYILFRKPVESGLLWALAACFLALRFGGASQIATAYFASAALILTGAIVETSYLLAYHDELTTLPSRRALNEALLRLQPPYSIAMVDIDHFKRCNDTYGHDAGDQVLRSVASKLARVSGGGEPYRYGGEEFAILFSGKTTAEVLDHLENLRSMIEGCKLRLRGPDRRQQPRGADRRNQKARGRMETGRAIRRLAQSASSGAIAVTVSMGVATSRLEKASPQDVIDAADKALYRAKAAGRNRIETSAPSRRRMRSATAGIA